MTVLSQRLLRTSMLSGAGQARGQPASRLVVDNAEDHREVRRRGATGVAIHALHHATVV